MSIDHPCTCIAKNVTTVVIACERGEATRHVQISYMQASFCYVQVGACENESMTVAVLFGNAESVQWSVMNCRTARLWKQCSLSCGKRT